MPIILVPVLRAGLTLTESFLSAIPEATVAHMGFRNHKTLQPSCIILIHLLISPTPPQLFWIRCWRPLELPSKQSESSRNKG